MQSHRHYSQDDDVKFNRCMHIANELQRSRGYEKRSELHAAVLEIAEDEGILEDIVDDAVLQFCKWSNQAAYPEVAFIDVKP